jgi:hypothetical protein
MSYAHWGEMAEWLMALVLKTGIVKNYRGFESLSLLLLIEQLNLAYEKKVLDRT